MGTRSFTGHRRRLTSRTMGVQESRAQRAIASRVTHNWHFSGGTARNCVKRAHIWTSRAAVAISSSSGRQVPIRRSRALAVWASTWLADAQNKPRHKTGSAPSPTGAGMRCPASVLCRCGDCQPKNSTGKSDAERIDQILRNRRRGLNPARLSMLATRNSRIGNRDFQPVEVLPVCQTGARAGVG